ncbi:MAG TPA: glycosyltransferase family 9 protein [Bryobacteraceae bacterium]|nr:glycosyltransferase family 9 protein [Bryobacteraceae bacterium]
MAGIRILVVRLSAMGDVIHALPAAASLKHSFPHSHLAWAIRPRWAPLLAGNPFVDEIIPLTNSARGVLRAAQALRRERFDVVVDFQALIQSALLTACARSDKKVGLHRSQARESAAALFYSSAVLTRSAHRVDRNLELAAAAGATSLVRVFPLPEGKPEASLPEGKFVLACPFAGWGSKQWPVEFYEDLARALPSELGMPLVVNGPPESAALLARIGSAYIHLSGLDGLIDATRRAQAVLGVDSGPLHIAAALSRPGVAIYGPTDPAQTGPYGGSIRVLRAGHTATTYKRSQRIHPSMRAIEPSAVLAALDSALTSPLKPASLKSDDSA